MKASIPRVSDLPPQLWRRDASLARVGTLLERDRGGIRVVSFDFFDTLVWRLVDRPADLFQELGRRLVGANLLTRRTRAEDFAALRRMAESKAHEHQVAAKDKNHTEVSLRQIYAELKCVCSDPAAAASIECRLEEDFCFANPVLLEFAQHAKAQGFRLVVLSDMYLSGEHLRSILAANGCDPNLFELVLTSSEAGGTKSTGALFQIALKKLGINADQMLHIGDNLDSDVLGARKAGVRACHYVQETPESRAILDRESLLQAPHPGQFSVRHLRLLAARHFAGDEETALLGRSGAFLMGPLLARFATWACREFESAGVRQVGAFMREGELLSHLLRREAEAENLPLRIEPLFINRKSTDLAAIGKLTADDLMDWLGRRATLPVKAILADFGLSPREVQDLPIALDAKVDGAKGIMQLARCLFTPEIAGKIEARSAEERRKVIDYLRPWLESGSLGVVDIGYNASAQVQLKRILDLEGMNIPIVGCYLMTTSIAAKRVLEGLEVHSFLGAFGTPEGQFNAFLRSPIFIEQAMAAPIGTTLGYERQADGRVTPVLDQMPFDARFLEEQRSFKDGILHYQTLWLHYRRLKPELLEGLTPASREILTDTDRGGQMILARAAAFPLQSEVAAFGAIPLDDPNLAGKVRTTCGETDRAYVQAHGFGRALREPLQLWPQGAQQLQHPRASAEFFSYAKAMLFNRTDRDLDSTRADLAVILRAGTDLGRLKDCVRQLRSLSRRDWRCELSLLGGLEKPLLEAAVAELAAEGWQISITGAGPQQSMGHLLNRAAELSTASTLLFLDDAVSLPKEWDARFSEVSKAAPEIGGILGVQKGNPDQFTAFEPAQCLWVRRIAFREAGGLKETLPLGVAFWNLLMEMHNLAWEWRGLELGASLIAPEAQTPLSAGELDLLTRRWSGFHETLERQLSQVTSKISLPTAEKPELVSLLILVRDQLDHTRRCLESIAHHTPEPHEIILVDNGSTAATREWLREFCARNEHVTLIVNHANRGFAGGNNQGMRLAKGEFLLLLNNDTIVTAGWLSNMLSVLRRYPAAGMVGPRSNCVVGPQLVAPVAYQTPNELAAFAAEWVARHTGESRANSRLIGFCLLMRRAVVEAIGGLDERYGNGNFEDDDFAIRARLAGFEARIVDDSYVHHVGGQTFKGAKIDYRQAMLANWQLFKTKWHLPASSTFEEGYQMPDATPAGVSLVFPLPALNLRQEPSSRIWTEIESAVPTVVNEPVPGKFVVPDCALVGHLGKARESLRLNRLKPAWDATLAALAVRPHHPEAYVLLARIAAQAGDGKAAARCAQMALDLAPAWKEARQFAKKNFSHRSTPAWLTLPAAMSGKSPRISVCLIVRNEEKFLDACLASVRGLADEIIVVDTGSTDRTVDIAREHRAQVHHFAWCDDFGAARNAALLHATGDWVLMLDADETLPESSHAALRRLIVEPAVMAWRLPIMDHGSEDQGCSYVPRLFRNAPALFYLGRIHEQVYGSIEARRHEWGLDNRLGDAMLLHFGYDPAVIKDRNKIERNLRLLERAVVELPGSPNLLMNYGLELSRSGRVAEALVQYRLAFEGMAQLPDELMVPETREVLLLQMCSRLTSENRFEEVVEVLTSPLAARGGLNASLHFSLGLAYLRLRRFAEGEEQMLQCLAKRGQPSLSTITSAIRKGGPRHCLALCLAGQGRKEIALEACRQAVEEEPGSRPIRFDYARFLADAGQLAESLQLLHTLATEDPHDANPWQFGGVIALSQPAFLDVAVDWTSEARRHLPGNSGITAQNGEALLLAGQAEQALAVWRELGTDLPASHFAARALAELSIGAALSPISNDHETQVSKDFLRWYQRLLKYGAENLILAVNEALAVLQPTLPTASRVLAAAMSEAHTVAAP